MHRLSLGWRGAEASNRTAKGLIINAKGVFVGGGGGEEPCCESWEAFEVVIERN